MHLFHLVVIATPNIVEYCKPTFIHKVEVELCVVLVSSLLLQIYLAVNLSSPVSCISL